MESLIFSTVYFEIIIFITFFVFKIINKKFWKNIGNIHVVFWPVLSAENNSFQRFP